MAPLRDPGAVLLISCYEMGHQPLAVASAAGALRRAGFAPAALDLAVERLDPARVERARLVALSVPMHTALRLGMRAARRVKDLRPAAHLCFFGLYASLNAATLLDGPADSVIGGEFEEPLLRLAERLEAESPEPAPGVRTRRHAAGPWIRKIARVPPERDLLPPLDRYVQLEEDGARRPAGQVEASRGCLHLCRHCPIPPVYGGRFFVVPREVVLADARRQVEAGATHVSFADPDFLNGPGHVLAVARALHEAFPALTFDATAKISHLLRHRAILPELRRLGCLFIVSAVESLSDPVLAILAKGHTRADVETALDLARDAGLVLRPTFVPFTPWSGLDDYRALLDFAAARDLVDRIDPVQLTIRLLVPPGSLLADHPEMLPHRGPLETERFTWSWKHPDPRVDRLQATVAAIAERAALEAEDPRETFERLVGAADRAAGAPAPPAARRLPPRSARHAPRLTEPWFC